MNIASSKSIGALEGRLDDGEEVSSPFSWGGGRVVRYRGVIKEKSPDFRSPEVGISAKRLSPKTFLLRTPISQMIFFNQGI